MKPSITVTLLAAALALAACSGDDGTEPSTSATTVVSESPTQTPTQSQSTPTETTPEASAEELAAKQAVVDFWKLRDELGTNPELGVTRLAEVARGQAFDLHSRTLNDQAREGLRQEGSGIVTQSSVTPGPGEGQMVVTACLDVSGVDVVDSDGNSVVPAGRPDRAAYDYTVERDGDRWYVIEDLVEAKDC